MLRWRDAKRLQFGCSDSALALGEAVSGSVATMEAIRAVHFSPCGFVIWGRLAGALIT